MVNPTQTIHRHSYLVFFFFVLFALWAFWPGYFAAPLQTTVFRLHIHAWAGLAWCLLLVSQAALIRTDNRSVHRLVGSSSYVLAPVLILSTISSIHAVLGAVGTTAWALHFAALTGAKVVLFTLAYMLAIVYRRVPAMHARFMICTALPFVGPIFNRLLDAHLPGLVAALPRIGGELAPEFLTYPAVVLLLAGLSIWDWRANTKLWAFPAAALAFGIVEMIPFSIYRFEFWGRFVETILRLPLS